MSAAKAKGPASPISNDQLLRFYQQMVAIRLFEERVNDLYTTMRDALRRGDWTAFGKAYEDLGRVLRAPAPR